jgi:transposase
MARHPKPDPKRKALQESGTANPHAEHVQDPAFAQGDFFDPRDLLQVKYEMLRRVRTEGHSVTEAVTRFGVSRPTFYKAQEDFDRAGLVGLLPGKRGPHGPHKITHEVMGFIQEMLALNEPMDASALVDRVQQRFGLIVHRRTVERAVARSKKKRR